MMFSKPSSLQVLLDFGDPSSYEYVRVLFEEANEKVYAVVEKDTVEVESIWYDFDVKLDLDLE